MNKKTLLIHGGKTTDAYTGAVTTPIYQTSTYEQDAIGELRQGYEYSRTANPTRTALETLIADLEHGTNGYAFGSGMAAISAVIMLLDKGDHILINSDVYGGTYRALTKVFTRFGITFDFINTTNIENIESSIKEETKMLFVETPSNPLLQVTDIKAASNVAKKHHILTVVDNTFMTPYYQNPLDLGADIVLHSATKYLGGHSDVVSGLVVTANESLGERIGFIQNSTGGILGPQDSYLLTRGIKTLGLRLEQINRNVKEVVELLKNHDNVVKTIHPLNEDHVNRDVHFEQASGYPGIISFEVADVEKAKEVIKHTKLFTLAESLGAVESLISVPSLMTHASIPAEIRHKEGIADGMIRLSIGIEDTEDLVADLNNALNQI
ncbi:MULTISPECIES: aminotransferase class I/II-fold pyridoxal phosphate-dependent enzyme [Mammaliicoccus]|uniref:Aminotransferase class I/II-fold pyridoxal phosphate-dependent enzyme n=1 Tax=Mammaliicoccus fleurettii TaxID=150056 RepID=A0ABS5MS84_9STAP|nr:MULTISPECIES: aminotransferase class I/II-fold pyridoxal phosphate-dependent enzyme [Mammaliicoccus]MBL0848282.1 aminotransferase class I/II-fold pyridoxal phosphate-dependent enzyme [Mammaliicoccus fleurettii]MBO3063449.1 aminotransferase class I/II-fold pyridoxal phosphate-dependent enzyme [Mammaliicoccus fleurettii]MBS3673004.1 aminotransferase class I/II-fold pyridoxal phosphate-dependent enzyme [Mammaliicoccus fleurettii]MBS3698092.1 aminotransferase class I/II-fold pyridoxal phosphate-